MKEEGGGGGRGGQKGWPYRRLLPPTDTQALWDFTLGLQRREDWNSALLEIRPEQNQNLNSLPRGGDQSPILSSGSGPFDQIPGSRTRSVEKQGRIGRVKERKERGKGREVNKVSCSLLVKEGLFLVTNKKAAIKYDKTSKNLFLKVSEFPSFVFYVVKFKFGIIFQILAPVEVNHELLFHCILISPFH